MSEKKTGLAIVDETKHVEMRKFIMLVGDQPTEEEVVVFDKAFESAALPENEIKKGRVL